MRLWARFEGNRARIRDRRSSSSARRAGTSSLFQT
jgi:hypothetical protein